MENDRAQWLQEQDALAQQVEFLSSEMKLLAINLAVSLARLRNRGDYFRGIEDVLSDLINRANDASDSVQQVLGAFQNQKRLLSSLPASSDIIKIRGGYDKIEVSLTEIESLSRNVIETIKQIKDQKKAI